MTHLHHELSDVFSTCADVTAVSCPKMGDISYRVFGEMIAGVQSVISMRSPRAVGILSVRCLESYIVVLAAFFSGVRFVPLNPELPQDRLASIIRSGQVDLVLHDGQYDDVEALVPDMVCDITTAATVHGATQSITCNKGLLGSDIAYHMFTSGSTGEPKGVPITYDNLSIYITGISNATGRIAGGRFSQLFDLSFDLSMHDIFVAFASGGTLVPASKIDLMMPHAYIQKKKIDFWFSVPLMASVALRGLGDKQPEHKLTKAMFCGEQLPRDYAAGFEVFVKPDGVVYNLYGPTEATIAFTAKQFTSDSSGPAIVPLGEPFGKNIIMIETASGEIVEATEGNEGELLLGGPQVFGGYVPDNRVECFVGGTPKLYRSGDFVRVEGGDLHHLGRKDNQIKLRGYRIELGDIEAAFRKAFGCPVAMAIVMGEGNSREIGLAYQQDSEIEDLTPIKNFLPDYMIPSRLLRIDSMPTNINGKADYKQLRAMQWPD